MKVVELKSKLKSFGLSTSVLKAELIERLKMYVADTSEDSGKLKRKFFAETFNYLLNLRFFFSFHIYF